MTDKENCWKVVPLERSYDMRARAILAFNTATANGADRDDALQAAWQAEFRAAPAAPAPFQQRVQPWMLECFGAEIAGDRIERNHRFFEEATELVQANGMTRSEAHQLVDYTFDRPVGDLHQEVGGVMVTLAALCLASGADMHAAGETELARIWTKVEQIRAKQAAKPKHSPLPAAPAAPTPLNQQCQSCFFKGRAKCLCSEEVADPDAAQQSGFPADSRAENTAAIAADDAGNSDRAQVIARAVAAHGREWPEQLTSGVLFYEGERITKAEFLAEAKPCN